MKHVMVTLSFDLLAARVHAIYRLPLNRAMNSSWNVGRLARVFAVSFCVSVGSVLATVTADSPAGQRVVELGPPINLADMAVTKQAGPMKLPAGNVSTNSLTFQVDEKNCFIYPAPEGYDYLAVEDLEPFTQRAEPQLPMKTFVVQLDKDAEVYGVEVVGGTSCEVKQPVHIVPVPWVGFTNDGKYILNETVYRTNVFFPGTLVGYDRGLDNQRQHVFVRFFPLQYIPGQRKAVLVTRATLRLYYGVRAKEGSAPTGEFDFRRKAGAGQIPASEAACVIICPEVLRQQAGRLSEFHTKTEGISSTVVTTEAIGATYEPAGSPPFSGYSNQKLWGWNTITNYQFTLARQIVAYLRDQEMHPGLVYVTILGDGLLVPPSYYYFGKFQTTHQSWRPTDFFYASPDYDFVPNYAVGRLSVNDAAEADHLVDKIIRWHRNAKWEWFRNVWLAGGRADDYEAGLCEMAFDKAEAEGLFAGMQVKKLYLKSGRLDRAYLLPALTTASVGILYYSCHGTASDVRLDSTIITGQDVLDGLPDDHTPVVFGEACHNGDFDLDLMKFPFGDYGMEPFGHSFGECVLKSPAGGIAFFGMSRLGCGTTLHYLQGGEPRVSKVTHNTAMMRYALRSYHRGSDTLGQLYSDALYSYVANNKMAGYGPTVWMCAFVLLGDPALKIPVRP